MAAIWLAAILSHAQQAPQPPPGSAPGPVRVQLGFGPATNSAAATNAPATSRQPDADPLVTLMTSQPLIDTESTVVASSEFDPPVVRIGQRAIYRVTLNALIESVNWPEGIATPAGLEFRAGGRGTHFGSTGTNIVPQTAFLYHTSAPTNGVFTVPAFTVKAYGQPVRVPAATLTVVPAGVPTPPPAPRLIAETPGREFYVGQSIPVRVVSPPEPDGRLQVISQPQVLGNGLAVDRTVMLQRVESTIVRGQAMPALIFDAVATPLQPGQVKLTVQGFAIGPQPIVLRQGNTVISFPQYFLIDSEPIQLTIHPLPQEGELPGFNGAIGKFQLPPPVLSTNRVRAGNPVQLTITVKGDGNLERLVPPRASETPQWQSFPAAPEATAPVVIRQRGFATFTTTLIPLEAGNLTTPPFPFSYFDPAAKRYVDLTVPPVAITVDPAPGGLARASTNSIATLRMARTQRLRAAEAPLTLSGLSPASGRSVGSLVPLQRQPWFPALAVLPLGVFGTLWAWDRRRRFLEQHREIVIRRKARRALRRHLRGLRHATDRGDAEAFVHHAIGGLREACAPRASAEPGALVCTDVVGCLTDADREAQADQVVRRLFASTDGGRYGHRELDRAALLALRPQIERLLIDLDNRL